MLYLEDYLEMIEHLPQELKDRFTEIRELDLQVQNSTDKLDDRAKLFFLNARKQKTPERDAEFEAIRSEYYKVLEDADEKVHQANQMHELVEKYVRKLDQELLKFKMELEADNAGITEVLERRSLDLDMSHRDRDRDYISQKENRYSALFKSEKKERKERLAYLQQAQASGSHQRPYSLNRSGPGSAMIFEAASQALAATQQMQHGRRTASLKASYDAVNLGLNLNEFSVGRELLNNADLHQAAQQALAASGCATGEQKRNKRKSHHLHNQDLLPQPADELLDDSMGLDAAEAPADWTEFVDPSEPRYCICNQVSYGDMIACDNNSCPYGEWFHYGCVGVETTPKGKWYCPPCSQTMQRRRGRRANANKE